MAIILAEAAIDENGQTGYEGHQKGDQNGNEVRFKEFYRHIGGNTAKPWVYVFRCKNTDIANAYTVRMGQAVQNANIGYGQPSRADIRKQLSVGQPDPSKITTRIDCDCSSLMNTMVAVTFETQNVKTNITGLETTAAMPSVYKASGWFDDVTSQVNLATGEGLKRGDILVRPSSHTACVYSVDTAYNTAPKWVGEVTNCTTCQVYADPSKNTVLSACPLLASPNLIDVCDESNTRFYVRISGKYYGWVEKKYIKKYEQKQRTGTTTTALYMRTGNFDKEGYLVTGNSILTIPQNATVSISSEHRKVNGDLWYNVTYHGATGYSSAKYIK